MAAETTVTASLNDRRISIKIRTSGAYIEASVNGSAWTRATLAAIDSAATQDDAAMALIYAEIAAAARELLAQDEAWRAAPVALQALAGRLHHTRVGVAVVQDYLRTPAGGWGETVQAWTQLENEAPEAAKLGTENLLHLGRMLGARIHPSRT